MENTQSDKVELFDRQFVTNILLKVNQCPNCRNSYSCYASHKNTEYVKYKRPFLLPCGHNVCENCVFQHRKNLICKICNKRVEIAKFGVKHNRPKSAAISANRDLDLNFFLYGQTHYWESFKPELVGISKHAMASDRRNGSECDVERLCFLCKTSAAVGLCDTCNDYLCLSCWQEHQEGRIDTKESRTMMDTHSLRQTRIDTLKDQQSNCSLHARPVDCYCRQCNKVCCLSCARRRHDKHGWKTLLCENQSVQDEVLPMLEKVAATRKNLQQSLKDLDCLGEQLDTYGVQTLKDVQNYFTELHSLLQAEQQHIIAYFQEKCQQPQAVIEDARWQLSQAVKVLNLMHSNLMPFRDAPPINTNLKRILALYNKELNDLPFKVEVSPIPENPFVFEPQADLSTDFDKYFQFGYKNPKVRIECNPIYGSPFSSRNNDARAEDSPCNTSNTTANTTTNTPTNTPANTTANTTASIISILSKNTLQTIPKHAVKDNPDEQIGPTNNVANETFTQMLTSNSSRSSSPGVRQVDDHSNSDVVAIVRYIKSPSEFYINMESDMRVINEFTGTLSRPELDNEVAVELNEGQVYLTYIDNDTRIHRVMLCKFLPYDYCRAYFVDIGNVAQIKKDRFLEMDEEYAKIPYAAMKSCLYDIEPFCGDKWSKESIQFLKEIIENKPTRVAIIQTANDMMHVEVMTTQCDEQVSVRDALLYSGLAKLKSNQLTARFPKSNIIAPKSQRLTQSVHYTVGKLVSVKVVHIEDPYEFYVVRCNQLAKYEIVLEKMKQLYEPFEHRPKNLLMGYQNMCCAVCIQNVWQRGRIMEIFQTGSIRVQLVDTGAQHVVHWRQLFELDKTMRYTELATPCMLADIEPFQENNYEWTTDAIQCFRELTSNPTMLMEVRNFTASGALYVAMHVIKKNSEADLDINIASILIEWKHGLTTLCTSDNPVTKIEQIHAGNLNLIFSQDCAHEDNEKEAKEISAITHTDKPVKKTEIQRTPLTITHIVSPGEFYIQLNSLSTGIERFHNQIQDKNKKLLVSPSIDSKHNWSVGDHCYVLTTSNANNADKHTDDVCDEFYRAIIITATGHANDEVFTVFLRDVGATVQSIRSNQLCPIDDHIDRVANAVHRCHLACVEPTGGANAPWAQSSVEKFMHYIALGDNLSATLQGKPSAEHGKSLPIILWASTTDFDDPFRPCITQYTNINKTLVNIGLVHLVEPFLASENMNAFLETDRNKDEVSLFEWVKKFDDSLRIDTALKYISVDDASVYDDQCSDQLTTERTTSTTPAPSAWQRCKGIDKTLFAAIPTYIDYSLVVYLHDAVDAKKLDTMRTKIKEFYTNRPDIETDELHYGVGQACIVKYHWDQKYYRAIVEEINEDDGELVVLFIDYGNVETVKPAELLPYAPFPSLPAFAHKYRIEGICPKNGELEYDIPTLDHIHKLIVTHQVSVRVPAHEMLKPIKGCSMRVGTTDVSEYIVNNGYGDPTCTYFKKGAFREHSRIKNQNDVMVLNSEADETPTTISISKKKSKNMKQSNGDNSKTSIVNVDMIKDVVDEQSGVNNRLNFYLEAMRRADLVEKPYTKSSLFNRNEYKELHDNFKLKRNSFSAKGNGKEKDKDKAHNVDSTLTQEKCDDFESDKDSGQLQLNSVLNCSQNKYDEMLYMDDEAFGINKDTDMQNKLDTSISDICDFGDFRPNETSSIVTHAAVMNNNFEFPKPELPKFREDFYCTLLKLISPTIALVLPHIRDNIKRIEFLNKRIASIIDNAPLLSDYRTGTKCLALSNSNKRWYRAVIRSNYASDGEALVEYVDFMDTRTLPLQCLRKCPTDLLKIPTCMYEVRLHGIKPNTETYDESVIQRMLEKVLPKSQLLAVVRKENSNNGKLTEVELYSERESKEPIYEELVQKNYYYKI